MRTLLLLILLTGMPLITWAEDDLSLSPGPKPTFLADHSYDNDDVDGTRLKGAQEGDIGAPVESAKDAAALKVLDQSQMEESKSPPTPTPEIRPTPVDTPSSIPAGL